MVRTRNTATRKVAGEKAARKVAPTPSSSNTSTDSKNKYAGGNPVCPRETPEWQKPITTFFPLISKSSSSTSQNGASAGSSGISADAGACGSGISTSANGSKPVGAFSALFTSDTSAVSSSTDIQDESGAEESASATGEMDTQDENSTDDSSAT